jgi:cation diffusion facilitator CzcD-associated flavoprotein CzcO
LTRLASRRYFERVRLRDGARIAVIGAGPSGIAAAKYALEAGFEPTVFEASDRLGGQWYTTAEHSGVWPGMHTNTSRELTAFSDFPPPQDLPLHPAAEQIHDYLETYARAFGVIERVCFDTRVTEVLPGWSVDGEPFDAVVAASGRFRRPRFPPAVGEFAGELFHTYDYPGAEPFADRTVLVYGNGVSGVEIASDLAAHTGVISAFRKSRYVIQKVVDGVASDWQWYSMFGALERRHLPSAEWATRQQARVLRVAGHPADFGAPAPDDDLRIAGTSLCQGYLEQIRDGAIACKPGIATVDGRIVTFTDGTSAKVDAIVCATGYEPDLPYLRAVIGDDRWVDTDLYQRTLHPDLPGLGVIGQFLAQGPYWPLLELQARWILAVWSGAIALPPEPHMRATMATPRPILESHNVLALALSEEMGVSPDPIAWPELTESLLFGPMLPARYRLSGPGARPAAGADYARALATAPCAAVDPADVEALRAFGLAEAADRLRASHGAAASPSDTCEAAAERAR